MTTELVFREAQEPSWERGGWVSKLQIFAITVLFVKKHDWHVFTIKTSGCWTPQKGKNIKFRSQL